MKSLTAENFKVDLEDLEFSIDFTFYPATPARNDEPPRGQVVEINRVMFFGIDITLALTNNPDWLERIEDELLNQDLEEWT